jgi:hypothetical protein
MNEHEERARAPLKLRCDPLAAWLWRVSWSGDAEPSQPEREELARVARSRESGALIVLESTDGADRPLPAALRALTGSTVAAIGLAALPPAQGCGAVELFAPRGRGRCVRLGAAAIGRFVEALRPREATARALEAIERALAEFAECDGWRPLPSRREALDEGELLPAAADSVKFEYETDGGERFVEIVEQDGSVTPTSGRLVRGCESFTLRLAAGGRPPLRRQLVLVRATASADRGALLRVELDDEDLGPWRLGDAQPPGRPSFDLFRISSDLLAGRERVRLALRLDGRPEIASLRWWFLTEEEPNGLWLTDLEPAAGGGERLDRAGDGSLLTHDDELFLRGIALEPGGERRWLLPRGERRLALEVAPAGEANGGAAAAGAELVVTADGASSRLPIPAGSRGRRAFTKNVAGGELILRNESEADGATLLLLAPRLLR